MQKKEIKLKTKEQFNGGMHSTITMNEPKVLHLRQLGEALNTPEGTYSLIEKTCNLSTDELNDFSSSNYFLLLQELSSFLEMDSSNGIAIQGKP